MHEPEKITPVVNSYNEWDPLEEVIVGRVEGAAAPPWHAVIKGCAPASTWDFLRQYAGSPYPQEEIEAANRCLEEFIHILEAEGVTVRRPDIFDFTKEFSTPCWKANGFCSASPRDVLVVFGNEIMEANMGWPSRFFEVYVYRSLINEYFSRGAQWSAAPKPMLRDEFFDLQYEVPSDGEPMRYVNREIEPVFDAADFIRCGQDIFVQRSNTTNYRGIEWVKRHLGDRYRIHILKTCSRQPMHVDTTFMPLCPGKLLINPNFIRKQDLPDFVVKTWEIFEAAPPVPSTGVAAELCSAWLSMNFLMLDEQRIIVEKRQEPFIKSLKEWGFKPVPCSFEDYYGFGGSFHCATSDIRRRGELKSYF